MREFIVLGGRTKQPGVAIHMRSRGKWRAGAQRRSISSARRWPLLGNSPEIGVSKLHWLVCIGGSEFGLREDASRLPPGIFAGQEQEWHMTLIVGVAARNSIWLCADRRLSAGGKVVSDDAVKVFSVETSEGIALLGYARLGKTGVGMEPSLWMRNVLRGRHLTVEASLKVLAAAMNDQLPRHIPPSLQGHVVSVVAFVSKTPSVYAISLTRAFSGQKPTIELKKFVNAGPPARLRVPYYIYNGSGAREADSAFQRSVNRLIKRYERGSVSAEIVADQFASFNLKRARSVRSVGPNCVVLWRDRTGGGGGQYYSGTTRSRGPITPTIGRGLDLGSFFQLLLAGGLMIPSSAEEREANAKFALEQFNKLPDGPDESLK